MNKTKTTGIFLLVVGLLGLVLSLIADKIGVGGSQSFGYKQIAGAVAGVVMTIAGLLLMLRK